ncbi:MAG: aminodeoxychorismate/anthranilate synthase component II [Ignavibacteria bacterium]|nr:aminodeoxychorismate/anthranilate synthase component II [Ignavibacteria bacterium]MBT8380894.1 aminodeoxychorismate/anthranilate synthase component II [Ignavibacteria bacterium]MBT8391027.1 aminodeoxychorismate/anthranilate synthase component II [Ignavibacteria bacterium]NNJ54175.1 aminodeoxychorismate/anthranilate synthase component II [Ignavibacteriaceae bacterium]NNL20682.1 aminodeoxychorismate/anthranilate synthase component II [Ignavibacteriaceae bacterium]
MKILIIDNYDSFTFNLVQLIGKGKHQLRVIRNDEMNAGDVKLLEPAKIILSPGPGRPENSKLSLDVIKKLGEEVPILGVCLGMQAICYSFGAEILNSREIFHGKTSNIKHNCEGIFRDLKQNFEAMRYHSLIVKRNSIPDEIEITASTENGVVMGIRHKKYPLIGIQFHPESILTLEGNKMITNWLE